MGTILLSCGPAKTVVKGGFPRLYGQGPQLTTRGARPATEDPALTPVFTEGELPLDKVWPDFLVVGQWVSDHATIG